MAYMQHMAVTLQPSPSGFHRWGRSPGALNVFHGRQSPIASLFRALILFCCRAWSPQNVCCGARSPKYCNSDILVHSALFVVGGESERRMPVYRARTRARIRARTSPIRVVTQCSSLLTAAHSSSAFLSLN